MPIGDHTPDREGCIHPIDVEHLTCGAEHRTMMLKVTHGGHDLDCRAAALPGRTYRFSEPRILSPVSRRRRHSRFAAPGNHRGRGQVRIIAGHWRGRTLDVVDVEGLRPTGDRVRETLFNWLQGDVAGAVCLDLFAGSGALGFEAASRGASEVMLIEPNARAFARIEHGREVLNAAATVDCRRCTAEQFLGGSERAYDIVFIDPPFSDRAQEDMLERLLHGHLASGARIYVEAPTREFDLTVPDGYETLREHEFGDVTARLLGYQ